MLDASTLARRVKNELSLDISVTNLHGISYDKINQFLVEPYRRRFMNPVTNDIEEYWVVLDQDQHSDKEGYLIIFSEDEDCFGIAVKENTANEGIGTFLSLYDSFTEALRGM